MVEHLGSGQSNTARPCRAVRDQTAVHICRGGPSHDSIANHRQQRGDVRRHADDCGVVVLPQLFRIPVVGTPVWTYGFMLATAFMLGLWIAVRCATEDGLPGKKIYDAGLLMIPSALVGAQLMNLAETGSAPAGHGLASGSYLGGFLMAGAVSAILMRRWRLPWRRVADAFAPSLALGYAIARMGCFLAGCCWGKPASSWIG